MKTMVLFIVTFFSFQINRKLSGTCINLCVSYFASANLVEVLKKVLCYKGLLIEIKRGLEIWLSR